MWFQAEVIFPRILKGFFLALVLQEIYIISFLLVFKILSWNPFTGFIEWLFYLIHWKSLLYQGILCLTTVLFGALNTRYYSVQKYISSTRFQKICRALSPSYLQHFVATAILGGITSYCCIGLFHSFDPNKTSLLGNCLQLRSDFEYYFVIQHGCYIGIMFSLKYFICCLYLLKFSLDQKTKIQCLKSNAYDLLKDSVSCVLKAMFWYYLAYFFMGPFLQNFVITSSRPPSNTMENTMYNMLSPTLFFVTFISGVIIFCNWNIYILMFNMCAVERYIFKTEMATKNEDNKCLSVALQASHSDILKYLAVLDLRLLSQHDLKRRLQIFAISHPGGHPYQWKSISDVCITSLKDLSEKLHAYAVAIAAREVKFETQTFASNITLGMKPKDQLIPKSASEKAFQYFRKWPTVCYFFDELPNSKIRQIFSSSQPLTWMAEAFGFLLSAAYVEDKYGVVQQMLPEIVCLLLDLKMAEEKLPIDPVGIKTHVRDPQDRYEHIHQRLALKTAVNGSLCRIAAAFKDDIKGIYLPDEYNRYFQRFISQKNV